MTCLAKVRALMIVDHVSDQDQGEGGPAGPQRGPAITTFTLAACYASSYHDKVECEHLSLGRAKQNRISNRHDLTSARRNWHH